MVITMQVMAAITTMSTQRDLHRAPGAWWVSTLDNKITM
jgi:hypothetical protein